MVNQINATSKTTPAANSSITLTNTKATSPNEITVPVGQTKKSKTPPFRDLGKNECYENYKNARAKYYFESDIKNGTLEYVEPTKIFGKEFGGHYFKYNAQENETLGDVKGRYNLADGTLRSQSIGGGGNFDDHIAPPVVTIKEEVMEDALRKQILHKDVQITD